MEKAAETAFVLKICKWNVDEIDTRLCIEFEKKLANVSLFWDKTIYPFTIF